MTTTFLHISDLHFPTKLSIFALKKKMYLGYYNFTFRRRHKHPKEIFEALLHFAQSKPFDGVLITGDLTNVSAEKEFETAKELLSPILTEKTLVVPGNHDRYTQHALEPTDLFIKHFANYIGENVSTQKGVYLRHKVLSGINFLSWDSNEPTSLTEASGKITEETLRETERFLIEKKIDRYILLCHHPVWNPPNKHESRGHKMTDREGLVKWLNDHPPLLYLHGHHHSNWLKLAGEDTKFAILNSASSTRVADASHDCGFYTFSINEAKLSFARYVYNEKLKQFETSNLLQFDKT
jgi:3',5'-cyclic AMP phosphodiesterase CpdA